MQRAELGSELVSAGTYREQKLAVGIQCRYMQRSETYSEHMSAGTCSKQSCAVGKCLKVHSECNGGEWSFGCKSMQRAEGSGAVSTPST